VNAKGYVSGEVEAEVAPFVVISSSLTEEAANPLNRVVKSGINAVRTDVPFRRKVLLQVRV
jgi:molybdopterin-binding protein